MRLQRRAVGHVDFRALRIAPKFAGEFVTLADARAGDLGAVLLETQMRIAGAHLAVDGDIPFTSQVCIGAMAELISNTAAAAAATSILRRLFMDDSL